ncbi:MAG: hypothetical protein AAF587_29535 [Bacteroidota bacterium]
MYNPDIYQSTFHFDQSVINKGFDVFGCPTQALKCSEELNELSAIIIKQHIHPEQNLKPKMTEEIADVLITLEHLKNRHDIDQKSIQKVIERKQRKFDKYLNGILETRKESFNSS